MDGLIARGVDPSRLVISASAHIITPYNVTLDKVTERFLGKARIGTTGRGIGPTYGDKMARVGVRIQDLMDPSILHRKVEGALVNKNQSLVKVFNRRAVDVDQTVEYLLSFAERLRPHVVDTALLLNAALDRGETVVLEGGQGTLLDVDHGTYPYVTSSNPTAGGACTGSGIGPTRIDRVLGILKAYTTRVGEGPFPTELLDDDGERLRTIGGEVGVTTGRDRRCGWFDAPIARYATRVNGMTDYFLTKLDVLSSFEDIPVCVAYDIDGQRVDEVPPTQTDFHHATPDLRGAPRLGDRHLRRARVRRPAGQLPGVRAVRGGAVALPGLGDRRGPRPGCHPGAQRSAPLSQAGIAGRSGGRRGRALPGRAREPGGGATSGDPIGSPRPLLGGIVVRIGVPKESRPGETRVAATPKTVEQIVELGYAVFVESGAGPARRSPMRPTALPGRTSSTRPCGTPTSC